MLHVHFRNEKIYDMLKFSAKCNDFCFLIRAYVSRPMFEERQILLLSAEHF